MRPQAAERVKGIAQDYVDGYFRQVPEDAAGTGYPNAPADRLGDWSLPSLAAWEAREDAWLEELRGIPAEEIEGTDAELLYAITRERLEASVERRSYRPELWNVSTAWGWASQLPV